MAGRAEAGFFSVAQGAPDNGATVFRPSLKCTGPRWAQTLSEDSSQEGWPSTLFWRGVQVRPDVATFLRALLRQVRGRMVVVLDGLPAHRTTLVGQVEKQSRGRLKLEWLPGYAPELNATEYLWGHTKGRLANRAVLDNEALLGQARSQLRSTQRRPDLLKSFWKQTGLAWP